MCCKTDQPALADTGERPVSDLFHTAILFSKSNWYALAMASNMHRRPV